MAKAAAHILALFAGSLLTASLLTLLALPSALLPWLLAATYGLVLRLVRPIAVSHLQETPSLAERVLIGLVLLVAALRIAAYGLDGLGGHFALPVTFDDRWHFQELASLVTSERFPPRLNFAPDRFLHFYYLPLIPAAALAHLVAAAGLAPPLKLCYALGTLVQNLATATVLILLVRHLVPRAARTRALVALGLACAVPDGLAALVSWATGSLAHAEWWQDRLLVHNQFSSLTTALIWVPHHLAAAAALLLAVVILTEPQSLQLRRSPQAFVAAGLLAGYAAFSSVFVVMGAAVTLLPLAWQARRQPLLLLLAAAVAVIPALPLAYIYLRSEAAAGFLVMAPFRAWQDQFGSATAGLLGTLAALVFMVLEAGWLYLHAARRGGRAALASGLGTMATGGMLYLASTAWVSFDVWNNYAMRGAIVPVIVIACFWAAATWQAPQQPSASENSPLAGAKSWPAWGGLAILALAACTHLNELTLFARDAARSIAAEPDRCGAGVTAANATPNVALDPALLTDCADSAALYSLARPFPKPKLRREDRELMGPGP